MSRLHIKGRRLKTHGKKLIKRSVVSGGSIKDGHRDDLLNSERQPLVRGELGQAGMDNTMKRNLMRTGKILGNKTKAVSGGTMMDNVKDPLADIKLPKFTGVGKKIRNNIKLSI